MNTQVAHQERAHSDTVGGSSAARVVNCPGHVQLAKTLPKPGTSSFAEEGTALHEAMDVILNEVVKKDDDVIGMEFNGYVITQEMFDEGIAEGLAYLDSLYDELEVLDMRIEQRVKFVGIEGAFGTVDILMKCKDRTVVFDWKFGTGVPVSAENNMQLQFYAYAGAVDPATCKLFDDDLPVELIIAQPRMREENDRYTRWMTDMPALKVFAHEVAKAVEIARGPDAPFKLGKHCKFCPAEPACPLKNDAVDNALTLKPDLELIEDMQEWLKLADEVESWIAAVRKLAHDEAERGISIPGYKLVAKRASQAYDDPDAMTKKLRNAFKIDEAFPRKMVTPAQARKLYKAAGKKFPEDMIVWRSSGNTLAPESDKRDAIVAPSKMLENLSAHLASK